MAKRSDRELFDELKLAFDRNNHGPMYQWLERGANPNYLLIHPPYKVPGLIIDPNGYSMHDHKKAIQYCMSSLLKSAISNYCRPRTKLLLHFGATKGDGAYIRLAIQEAVMQEKKDILKEIQYFDEFFPKELEEVMLLTHTEHNTGVAQYPSAVLAELLYRGRNCPKMERIAKKYVRSGLSYKHHTNHFVDSQAHMLYLGFHAQAQSDFRKELDYFPEILQEMVMDYIFRTPKFRW
jgi:hypothetical protein